MTPLTSRPTLTRATALLAGSLALFAAVAGGALASHGPTRAGSDACNGTDAFNINNLITRGLVDAVAAQNPGARNPDGTLDRTKITHGLVLSSGHVPLQFREKPGFPLSRLTFEFTGTDSRWSVSSTNHPGYLSAAEAREDLNQDADSDSVVGKTFVFPIPTDVVSDGNYVARIRAFGADGSEVGRICVDATVSNGQGAQEALKANTDPAYEPTESTQAGYGFAPQPVAWFPAAEPTAAQQAGYGAKELRLEFAERLQSVSAEREEDLPTPTGLAGTASTTGGSLATGTYFYVVTALNETGETKASSEISVPVTGPTGSVALSWNPVARATGYRVYRGTSAGGENVSYTSTTNSFTDTGAAGAAGSPPSVGTAKIWVDYGTLLARHDFSRSHNLSGSRSEGTPFERLANKKVWGPGYRFSFAGLAGEALPSERLRVRAQDAAGKSFCGIYTFSAGSNGSFLASAPGAC